MLTLRDREILRIAVPSIVSNITVPLLGLMDVAITGHLGGAAYVGAIAVGGMLFNVVYWLFAFLRMGTSGMTAQAFGAKDIGETQALLRRAIIVALSIAAAILILQVPIRDCALWLIDPSAEVLAHACSYFDICIWGAPAVLMLFALNGWFIGMQNSRLPMLIAIAQNIANIALSILFVYVFSMKIEGVALGTVLAQYVGLAIGLCGIRSIASWKSSMSMKFMCSQKDATSSASGNQPWIRFFTVNRDFFLRTLCLIYVHFYFISAGAGFGDIPLAVNALLMQLYLLYSYVMDGFAFAGEALVGKAIGACDSKAMHDTVKRLFLWGAAMIAVFTATYATGGKTFLSLLSDDTNVVAAAMEYQPWTLLFPVCGMAAFTWDGIFIGATASRGMLISMAIGMTTFFAVFHAFSPTLLNHALWLAFCAYIAMRGIVQTIYFKRIKI